MRPLAAAMFVIISMPTVLLFAQFLRSRAFFKSSNLINPVCPGFARLYFWFGDPNRKISF
jgi:hypothetical protein